MSSLLTSWPSQFEAYPCPLPRNFPGISVKFLRWGLPGVRAFVAVPVEFSSVFWKQRHVALYSDKGALVLDTFNTCLGYLGRFRLIYNSPRSWSSRKDKSTTGLQSATKFVRHCTQIGYLQRTKESTALPPPLHSKEGCLLFSIGSSNSGTIFPGGDGEGKDLFSPSLWSQ